MLLVVGFVFAVEGFGLFTVYEQWDGRGGGGVSSQERLWFVLIMMLGKALRLFLQVPKSRAYLFI